MQGKYLGIFVAVMVVVGIIMLAAPEAGMAFLIVAMMSAAVIAVIRNYSDDKDFVTRVFLVALLLRLLFGILVHVYDLRAFFGGDANTYDFRGYKLYELWFGNGSALDPATRRAMEMSGSGWGMHYLVGAIYSIIGRNILAAQSFCAVFGAATAPLVYICAQKIFKNVQVAKFSAISVAVFPAFIIWSSQLIKDGLIVFLLVLAITMVIQLQERFSYTAVILLIFSLFGIISLRFYIFYMVALAVAGSFVIGTSNSVQSVARRTAILVVMGVALTYLGVIRNASTDLEQYGDLERLQRSRMDMARSAESGFGEDVDVSTTGGAISAIPLGLVYLMLAPFPWQVSNFRQAITLPEVFLWWAMIPFMIAGLWYTVRHRLRAAFPVLIFSLMLTLAYSIFSGNVGTAYRQRTQIQVFLFMFIGVGWTLYKEKREDRKMLNAARQRRVLRSI